MKKIYEDDELILVDTQNANRAFPVVAFYGKQEAKYNYYDGLKINDLDDELEYKIKHEIYKYCVRIEFYKFCLQLESKNIVALENKNSNGKLTKTIEMQKRYMDHLKEDLDVAERFYNGKEKWKK